MRPSIDTPSPYKPVLERAIVRLHVGAYGAYTACSGVLVGPSVVITAAHCLSGSTDASSVYVFPNNDSTAGARAFYWEIEDCYVEPPLTPDEIHQAQRCDFALVLLDQPLGNDTGWFTPQLPKEHTEYRVRGWPADFPDPLDGAGKLVLHKGLLYYLMDARKGMSGGPIFRGDQVVGLVTWMSVDYNIGTPITPERIWAIGEANRATRLDSGP